jgi:hypothetical protein
MRKDFLSLLLLCLSLFNCSEDDIYRDEEYRNIALESEIFFEFDTSNIDPNLKTVAGVNDILLNSNNSYLQNYYYLNVLEGISRSSLWLTEEPLKPTGSNNGGNSTSIAFNNDFKISNKSDRTYILNSTNEIGELSTTEFFLGSEFNILNIKDKQSDAYGYYTPANDAVLTLKIEVFKNSNKINIYLNGGKITDNNRSHHSYFYDNYFGSEPFDLNDILFIDLTLLNIDNFFPKE